MTATIHWAVEMRALSSIVHVGETRGTDTLLRRELLATSSELVLVPLISGNAFRGRLRRVGEELFRDVLELEGLLSLPAAYALRNGGSLYKSGRDPLTGRRRAALRELVPPVGVFGCAAGAALIDGCLEVGKVVPQTAETTLMTGVASQQSVFDLVQMEEYSHTDDLSSHHAEGTESAEQSKLSNQMRFAVESFPAGTQFSSYLRLSRASDVQISFFTDVLATFARFGQLGGRLAAGHGRVTVDARDELVAGTHTATDWRSYLLDNRAAVLDALEQLG